MSGIKRYDEGGYGLSNMEEAADGSWVDYDSHLMVVMGKEQMLNDKIAALQQKLDSLSAKALEMCEEAAHVYQRLNDSVAPDIVCDCQTIHELGLLASSNQLRADATKGGSDDK